MKHTLPVILLAIFLPVAGFSQDKNLKTTDNLKIALQNEVSASAMYAQFSEAARKENLLNVSKLFAATSKAESCHASNHKRALETMGFKVDLPKAGPVTVKSTAENLAEGIKGETHEFTSMYPEFLKIADQEDVSEAITTFRYALETEKKHATLYQSVLKLLNSKELSSIPATWYVCPTCGNVYDPAGVKLSCEYCGTLKPRFIVF